MTEPAASSMGLSGVIASLESAGVPVADIRAKLTAVVNERPEVAIVGAFAGGLVAAMIVRRLGR